jgi:hypothetical protein
MDFEFITPGQGKAQASTVHTVSGVHRSFEVKLCYGKIKNKNKLIY